MSAISPRYDGFLPGRHMIEATGQGGFRFGGMSHKGSIMLLPTGVARWGHPSPFAHTVGLYDPMLILAETVDIVLLGTGALPIPLPPPIAEAFAERGMRPSVMTTNSAASTWNILLGEGRRVAAALVAPL